ncbi:MAG: hypothetical protein ABIH99_05500, partial [Candidatus Micrarchaeota archaeon]
MAAPVVYSGITSIEQAVSTASTQWVGEGWAPVAFLALLISFFIVAIAYMIAEFMRSPELNAWAKSELYEVMISAFIVGSLFGLILLANGVAMEFTDNQGTLFGSGSVGSKFIDSMSGATGKVTLLYLQLLGWDFTVSIASSLSTSFIPPFLPPLGIITFISFTPFGGLIPVAHALYFFSDMVFMTWFIFAAQGVLLNFFQEHMFRFFLPLGIVLRTFPLSRKLGSTLIALAIVTYVVYPLSLVFNSYIIDVGNAADVGKIGIVNPFIGQTQTGSIDFSEIEKMTNSLETPAVTHAQLPASVAGEQTTIRWVAFLPGSDGAPEKPTYKIYKDDVEIASGELASSGELLYQITLEEGTHDYKIEVDGYTGTFDKDANEVYYTKLLSPLVNTVPLTVTPPKDKNEEIKYTLTDSSKEVSRSVEWLKKGWGATVVGIGAS